MAKGTRQRGIAAMLYAAIVLIVTALPGGFLLTGMNPILAVCLFGLTWTALASRSPLWLLALVTAVLTVVSVPASTVSLWSLGGGVDDLGALMSGPSVYISTTIALIAFIAATVFLRLDKRHQSDTA